MSKLFVLELLGLALSEKQIPQIVETIRSVENEKKLWKLSAAPKAGAWLVHEPRPLVRCAILCLERALESEMDSMNGKHGDGETRDSQAAVLSVLLSILASKRVVLDRQHGRNRLAVILGSLTDSAK